MRWISFRIIAVLLATSGICKADDCIQCAVDYIANHLHISYEVVDNFENTPSGLHKVHLQLTNTGNEVIEEGAWRVYFSHFRLVNGTRFQYEDGAPFGDSGFKVVHINGNFHMLVPTDEFEDLDVSESRQIEYFVESRTVARTDIFPNWYVAADEAEPRVILSTIGENLDFVEPFTDPEQYKRNENDLYDPYTPEERYERYDEVEDIGQAPRKIIPTPVSEDWTGDHVPFNTLDWVIIYGDGGFEAEAGYLSEKLDIPWMAEDEDNPTSNYILLDKPENGDTWGEEQYSLQVSSEPNHVDILADTDSGVFWGIQSLLSLLYDKKDDGSSQLPVGNVTDYPRFSYRGMHMDVSRNFHSKEEVIKILDVMAQYKLNKFHFHLTDDEGWRLEINGLEELTEVGAHRCHDLENKECLVPQLGSGPTTSSSGSGYYTQEDYRQILTYAEARHITVLPEFDMPGHCHAAIKAMEARYEKLKDIDEDQANEFRLLYPNDTTEYISVQRFYDNALNPCLESTYDFVDKVIEEVKALHDGIQTLTVFNFGGDEVAPGAWEDSLACVDHPDMGENTTVDLQEYFVGRVAELVYVADLDLAGWEDGLMHDSHSAYDRGMFESDEVYAYSWNNIWENGDGHKAYLLANESYRVILSHATHLYYDHPYEPDPEERGLYWATRFTDTRKTFGYTPEDIYANIDVNLNGQDLDREEICEEYECGVLDPEMEDYVIGMQGQLWSELSRTSDALEGLIFPRLLALAERAWHRADWEPHDENGDEDGADTRDDDIEEDWEAFANTLGHRELARLDELKVAYELSPAGARITNNFELRAKCAYPGLPILYSTDNQETWKRFYPGETVEPEASVHIACSSPDGSRRSRAIHLVAPEEDIPDTSAGVVNMPYMAVCILATMMMTLLN